MLLSETVWGILTHLGDYWFVTLVSVVTWLMYERDRGPWPVIVVLGAIGLVTLLKISFAVPRPPGAGTGGYSFPSGHALGSTVAYLLLARSIGTRRAVVAAGAVVAIVATSRVAIGVHYPIDVAVGMGVGIVYLAIALAVLEASRTATETTGPVATDGGTRAND